MNFITNPIKAFIFDMDGVLTDTVEYHFLSWQQLAAELNISFTRKDYEKLLGLSRPDSMKLFLQDRPTTDSEFQQLLQTKNEYFLQRIEHLSPANLLPGVSNLLNTVKQAGFKLAVASSSRNTPVILQRLEIASLFDAVSDSNTIQQAKPAPDLFLDAADRLRVPPQACVVLEDSAAGVEAGLAAGMLVVGIGDELVRSAHLRYSAMSAVNLAQILAYQH
ncbi:beta-phosphoglucomutase [Sporomusa aerivorans]|uniref:beta-phosphoglucomutase n=1 Tax=Sporomusa aerivorans TaxID=204936 RepID=UPI00352A0C4F